ncbi:PhzF family phenazine biosynthesis protein [Erwinia sp. JUb26]|uniref:PhzF family phenazine biosynthesis protein n=1 Tax=Erwinia sp. JUb26 TaxID=2485126 RepID=UPI000F4A7353|nr:PhzF family phenazine biosynthesis protein [Erwinia sp. JUb26]ROR04901.1 PhzF family phenazine biosynthesis protein [Erwinia sp. JUb26]
MTQLRPFKQVDVFTSMPFNGNPLAVIMDADGLSDEQMQTIARWTNLSETTFVLPATEPAADYRVRIFTPDMELPFAGHPTLGTAHALLESGISLNQPQQIVQQCGVGLVKIRIGDDGALAFASPEAILTPFSDAPISSALNSDELEDQLPMMVADMGIRWLLVPMKSAEAVLAIKPDAVEFARLIKKSNVNGVMPFGPLKGVADGYEVRGLLIEQGSLTEDPVTGSANACLARYFQARGVELDYVVHQGTAIQRAGRVSVTYASDGVWIGGQTVTVLDGAIRL